MKPLKLLITALAVILLSKGAYSQIAFIDTFSLNPPSYYNGFVTTCAELNDSGFAALGGDITGYTDVVFRTDKNGKVLWTAPAMNVNTSLLDFYKSTDGNIVIAYSNGYTYFNPDSNNNIDDFYYTSCEVVKLNSKTGNIIWSFSLPSNMADSIFLESFSPATDGGFFISGFYHSDSLKYAPRAAVAKFDSIGNLVWFNKYDSTNTYWLNNVYGVGFTGIVEDNEAGLFLLFNNDNDGGAAVPDSLVIIKLNSDGTIKSRYNLQSAVDDFNAYAYYFNYAAENSADSSYTVFTSFIVSGDSLINEDLGFLKFNKNGDLLKSFRAPDTTFNFYAIDYYSIQNGNYTFIGFGDSNLYYLQTDSNGNMQWINYYTDLGIGTMYPIEDTGLITSGYISVLDTVGGQHHYDVAAYFLLKFGQEYATGIPIINPQPTTLSIYPNPTSDNLLIVAGKDQSNAMVKIYNEQGEQMLNAPLSLLQGSPQPIDVSNLSAGLYLITLQTGDELITKKFIKM